MGDLSVKHLLIDWCVTRLSSKRCGKQFSIWIMFNVGDGGMAYKVQLDFFFTTDMCSVTNIFLQYKIELPGEPIQFAYSAQTDGESIRLLFERPAPTGHGGNRNKCNIIVCSKLIRTVVSCATYLERFPETRSELQYLRRDINMGGWRHGLYTLNKEPIGLTPERLAQSRLVGIDPGKNRYIKKIVGH